MLAWFGDLGGEGIQIASWNGFGICVADSSQHSSIGDVLRMLASRRHILCFQEVHGTEAEILFLFERWLPHWRFFVSGCRDVDDLPHPAAGGVVTAVCPMLVSRASFSSTVLAHGRCISTCVTIDSKTVNVINIHNHNLSNAAMVVIGEHMEACVVESCSNPLSCFGLILGDLNFSKRGEQRFKVGRPIGSSSVARPMASGTQQVKWESILDKWTELAQPLPTHFSAKSLSCARLDRAFYAGPASRLLNLQVHSEVIGTPEGFAAKGLSEHAPLALGFGSCRQSKRLSVPKHICRTDSFKAFVEASVKTIRVLDLPAERQLHLCKKVLLEAARVVRNNSFLLDPEGAESTRLTLNSISRVCTWLLT